MQPTRVRVRQGGAIGGGMLLTTKLTIAYVGVAESATPLALDKDFVFMRAPAVSSLSLTTAAFLAANTPEADAGPTRDTEADAMRDANAPKEQKRKNEKTKKPKKKPSHPLVAVLDPAPGPRANALLLADKTLTLTVDRPTFHELGIPPGKGGTRRGATRVALPLRLPLAPDSRAARALAPPRIAPVDVVLSLGAAAPSPPASDGDAAAVLQGVSVSEMRGSVPRELCDVARSVCGTQDADDEELMDAMDAAQRVLTGLGIGEVHEAEETGVYRRRYDGLSNGELWESAVRSVVASLADGVADFAVIGALGMWSANVIEDAPGFGGDCGVVSVVQRNGQAVTYEIRPKADLT